MPSVSIIIPAYNEARRLPASLQAISEYLAGGTLSAEVIVVVERSMDGTEKIVEEWAKTHPEFHLVANDVQKGKGHAVRCGMRKAQGDLAFFMDADLSTPLKEINQFLAEFAAQPEVDVLIGNRRHEQSDIVKKQSFLRRKMGQTFNAILRMIVGVSLRDTQCGFKAFRRKAREEIFRRQQIEGFAFDVELLVLAQTLGFVVHDLPVEWHNAPDSKVHIVRDSWQMLLDALRVNRLVSEMLRKEKDATLVKDMKVL